MPCTFILDAGSQLNTITTTALQEYQITPTYPITPTTRQIQTLDRVITIDQVYIQATVQLSTDSNTHEMLTEFTLIPSDCKSTILGLPWITQNMHTYLTRLLPPNERNKILIPKTNEEQLTQKRNSTPITKQEILQLIQQHSHIEGEQPYITDVSLKIELISNESIIEKPYGVPIKHREAVKQELKRLISENIISEVETAYCISPAFIIPKKNGKCRLVVNYKKLNSVTKTFAYPFAGIEELLNSIPKI